MFCLPVSKDGEGCWQRVKGEAGASFALGPQLTVWQGLESPAESEGKWVMVVYKERNHLATSGQARADQGVPMLTFL